MGLSGQKNIQIPIPAEGVIPARLARIIEIGEHDTHYGVKDQVLFWYSLPTRLIDMPESDFHGKQSMIKTKAMTMSVNEKANLPDHINALRPGFAYPKTEDESVDLGQLLDLGAYVSVEHNRDDDKDRTYANIMKIMPPPEGMEVPALDTTAFYFNFEEPDVDVWTRHISDYMKEKIQSAVNYRGSAVEDMVARLEAMGGTS